MNFSFKTDLALENREIYQKAQSESAEISGISTFFDDSEEEFLFTKVSIMTDEASKVLFKPKGDFITIESPLLNSEIHDVDAKIIKKVSKTLFECGKIGQKRSILVVGLGNSDITPDSLGSKVAEKLEITRHLAKYSPDLLPQNHRLVSAIVPGVLGTTGIDTCEIVKGIVEKTQPELVIVIDALAAKEIHRVGTTIQISNAGIVPGSGVKNNRNEISLKTLGIPVVAMGVPTVVSVPSIVHDATDSVLNETEKNRVIESITLNKKYDFMVTPNTIDDIVENLSRILASSINAALGADSNF